ncbi:MAG: hypothetical protein JXB88_26155 [Spirochaetales bacterium]|nr:hypothetical protein [Spirochaetales bacterium]
MAKKVTGNCIPNPDCSAQFAKIAEQYKYLREGMKKSEETFTRGIEAVHKYLKEEFTAAIEKRINGLEQDLRETKKALSKINKKIFIATGGVAVLTFLIGLAVPFVIKLIGG